MNFRSVSAIKGHVHLYDEDNHTELIEVLNLVCVAIVEGEAEDWVEMLVDKDGHILPLSVVVGEDQPWELFLDSRLCAQCSAIGN